MRYAHESATGHVSWPGTPGLQGSMHKLMRQSSGNRFDSDYCGLADPAQPVRRSLRGAKHRAAGIARGLSPGGKRSAQRSEEHTSELKSLMRISYAVFFLTKKKEKTQKKRTHKYTT